ncbi:arsenate reductase ArsC [Rhodophyticola sp. CCM32]|uniref:arsenate reductase ArsC n=1 Tax=Rhodophyticola sp. CCM32 TaxID=2916397 RepID=UPI00107F5B45|nr:arsenate reductase ArsC [Rhodophyticola sp. CCM32]QBY00290.1 arsenate reductase ArsC [Rhodophyticola sp. CCM32]
MLHFLVLCTGNSARSILLEHILTRHSGGRIRACSAGSRPTGRVHPQSLILLDRLGYDRSGAHSKSWDVFATPDAPKMDAVITVCGSAAGETCPIWPGSPTRAHWGVEDPARAAKPDWPGAFQTAYDALMARANALFLLPFETYDHTRLQAALTKIGTQFP